MTADTVYVNGGGGWRKPLSFRKKNSPKRGGGQALGAKKAGTTFNNRPQFRSSHFLSDRNTTLAAPIPPQVGQDAAGGLGVAGELRHRSIGGRSSGTGGP